MATILPNREEEVELHQRLLNGDESASGEIFAHYMNWLVDVLKAKNYGIADQDDTLIHDAAFDAIGNYVLHPESYDLGGKTLRNFLVMSATGDLRNAWEKRQRQFLRERSVPSVGEWEEAEVAKESSGFGVELPQYARKRSQQRSRSPQDDPQNVVNTLVAGELWAQVQEIVPDETDRRLVALMSLETRSTTPYAMVLGIADQPEKEQREIVNRAKERLKKKLQRRLNVKQLGYNWD